MAFGKSTFTAVVTTMKPDGLYAGEEHCDAAKIFYIYCFSVKVCFPWPFILYLKQILMKQETSQPLKHKSGTVMSRYYEHCYYRYPAIWTSFSWTTWENACIFVSVLWPTQIIDSLGGRRCPYQRDITVIKKNHHFWLM